MNECMVGREEIIYRYIVSHDLSYRTLVREYLRTEKDVQIVGMETGWVTIIEMNQKKALEVASEIKKRGGRLEGREDQLDNL